MKKGLIILWLYLLSFRVAYAGDFIIGTIASWAPESKDIPLEICYNAKYNDYYPSRIFEIDHREKKYIVYNLHVVYLDSCSNPKIKTVKVKIPKEFKGVCCHVSSKELVYSFHSKGRGIMVSVPAIESDTLSKYTCSVLYSHPLNELSYRLRYMSPHDMELKEKRYMGIVQSSSYTLYYYNFSRRQTEMFEGFLTFE